MEGKNIYKKLFFGATLYTAGNSLLSIAKLILIPVYTHYLVPEQYGILNTVNTISIFLIMIMSFGIERAVAREYFDYEDNHAALKSYLVTLLIFTVALNLLVIVILTMLGFWSAGWWLSEIKIPFMPYMPIALAISSSTTFYAIFMVVLQVRQMPLHYVMAQMIRFLMIVGITLSFLIGLGMGALAVLWAELIGTMATAVMIAIFFHKRLFDGHMNNGSQALWIFAHAKKTGCKALSYIGNLIGMFDYHKLRKAMVYAFPLLIFELGGWIISGLDRLFLAKFRTLEEVGIYALGATLAQGLNVLTSSIHTAYLPFFFQTAKNHQQPEIIFARISGLYVLIIGFVCLIGMLFAKEIISFIAPSSYEKSNTVMRILLLSTFFWGLYRIAVLPLLHLKETRYLMVFIGLSMILSLAGNLFLIPVFGVMGAAWTNVMCYGLLFALALTTASKRYPIKYAVSSFWGVIALIVLSGLLLYDQPITFRICIFGGIAVMAIFLNYHQGNFF